MCKEVNISKERINAAFKIADENGKAMLRELFGFEPVEEVKPTLDDYTTIKTYEDACKALSIEPIVNKLDLVKVVGNEQILLPKHIIALMKLETISCALWGREWQPKPEADSSEGYWLPWFGLFTKDEIEDMSEEDRGALLSCSSYNGSAAGFGMLNTSYRSSYTIAHIGFRLCQETEEKAAYFGKQFIELWAEYLKFNFEVGGRLE